MIEPAPVADAAFARCALYWTTTQQRSLLTVHRNSHEHPKHGGFPGSAFAPQPDGTLLCPAGRVLTEVERRQERANSVRLLVCGAHRGLPSLSWTLSTVKESAPLDRGFVSAVYWPLPSLPLAPSVFQRGSSSSPACAPVLWRDWRSSQIRRQWINAVSSQTVEVTVGSVTPPDPSGELIPMVVTRAERAHWRLSWEQRLKRNARSASSPEVTVTLHGLPAAFAQIYGFALRNVAETRNGHPFRFPFSPMGFCKASSLHR